MENKEQRELLIEAMKLARENGLTIKNIALETGYSITYVSNTIAGVARNKDIINFILNCVDNSKLNQKLLKKWNNQKFKELTKC